MSQLKIFRSSAGSGKTYQLASEYIKLALRDPDFKFRHILAVTFTNKATAEMKSRIIIFLQKISRGEDEALVDSMSEALGLDVEALKKRANQALSGILHHYSLFSVSTIDSFYQRILRSFARETGLIGNFSIELDNQKVLDEVLDALMDELGKNKVLTKWLLQYSFEQLEQSKNWDIRSNLSNFAREIFSTAFKAHEDRFLSSPNTEGIFAHVTEQLNKIIHGFESKMEAIGREAEQFIKSRGLAIEDFSGGGARSVFKIFLYIQDKKYNFTPTVLKCLDDKEKWSAKTSPKKDIIRQAVDEKLDMLLNQAYSFYKSEYTSYISAKIVNENIYTLGIYHEIYEKLASYKAENDIFLLSDTGNFLKEIIADNEAPFLYEKTGSWYDHFLIDEFQDTSALQWNNFLPLIKNSLSAQQECLLVGDAKQSIYRWRGGDWSLILDQVQNDIFQEQLNYQFLTTNWRSAAPIVAFNNAVFSTLPKILGDYFGDQASGKLEEATEKKFYDHFTELYKNATQNTADKNTNKPGYVEFKFIENQKTTDEWKRETFDWLKGKLEQLQDKGFHLSDMVILVRTAREGREIVTYLQQLNAQQNDTAGQYSYQAVSDESLLIKDHSTIRFIIGSLQAILQPTDDLARESLKTALLEVAASQNLRSSTDIDEVMSWLTALRYYEISEIIESLIRKFELQKTPGATAYLLTFKEAVMDFLQKQIGDLASLVKWWDENKDRLAVKMPENVNAIKVMTIHKSKGLEFRVVMIPFCNWDTDHKSIQNNYVWCVPENEPYTELGVIPVKYSKKMEDSFFSHEYFEEKHLALIDNLNLTYVAFTRAEEVLLMCAPAKKQNKTYNINNISDAVMQTFRYASFELHQNYDEQAATFSYGSMPMQEENDDKKAPHLLQEYFTSPWQEKVKIRYEGNDILESFEEQQNINYGVLVHEILSKVKYLDDFDQVIDQYKWSGILNDEDYSKVKEQLDRALANPEIKKLFSKGQTIKTETPILTPEGEEVRPDRVIIADDETIVVDFKTGKPEPKHKKQILKYKQVLEQMGHTKVTTKIAYLLQNQVIAY